MHGSAYIELQPQLRMHACTIEIDGLTLMVCYKETYKPISARVKIVARDYVTLCLRFSLVFGSSLYCMLLK